MKINLRNIVRSRWIIALIVLFVSSLSFANGELEGLKQLFADHFYNDDIYTQNQCGDNIGRFAKLAKKRGFSLIGADLLQIENYGYDNFGLVGALVARGGGNIVRDAHGNVVVPHRYNAGTENWNHHVVLFYFGHIFDFDFTNSPYVIVEPRYWKEMFLDDNEAKSPQKSLAKIGSYMITSYNILDYLKYIENRRLGAGEPKKQKLKDRLPTLFQ